MKKETIASYEVEAPTSIGHRQRKAYRFLRGPIPIVDLALASKLGGQSLTLLILIHHRAALTRSPSVTLPANLLAEFGISRDSKARALHALEKESLIAVDRRRGRTARVTLLPHPGSRLNKLFAPATITGVD